MEADVLHSYSSPKSQALQPTSSFSSHLEQTDNHEIKHHHHISRHQSRYDSHHSHFSSSNTSRSGSDSLSRSPVHRPSPKSPKRDRQLKKIRGSQRYESNHDMQQRINAMAFSTTRHPSGQRYESIERPYDRPLSPITCQFLDENVFYPSSKPDRFKDVLTSNCCLCCYSVDHEDDSCPVLTNSIT